jgi:glycosyltransferase involved in cell wall biosynthesis
MMPHLPFRVIGLRDAGFDEAKRLSANLPNVTVVPGRIPLEDLLLDFWQAKVYLQPSIEERFGVSVAEAMSCGCIPLVAPVNALKEVVGEAGVIIPRENLREWTNEIERKLNAPESEHLIASAKAKQFDIAERARQLLSVVKPILIRG